MNDLTGSFHEEGGIEQAVSEETQSNGIDYNLAYIPASFMVPKKEDFDTEYIRQLFDVGYSMAARGYPWQKVPPGLQPSADTVTQ